MKTTGALLVLSLVLVAAPVVTAGDRTPRMRWDSWLFWWAYNRDDVLDVRSFARDVDPIVIEQRIAPALRQVLGNPKVHPDIRGGAALALARCRVNLPDTVDRLLAAADPTKEKDRVLRESAIVALAVSGSREARVERFLVRVAGDESDWWRIRCFALVALGLRPAGTAAARDCLLLHLVERPTRKDFTASTLLGLGLLGDRSTVPVLTEILRTGNVGERAIADAERAGAAAALGKIGDPRALPALVSALAAEGYRTRASAAVAIGQTLERSDPETIAEFLPPLVEYVVAEEDVSARNLAVMALGRIGAAAGPAGRRKCSRAIGAVFAAWPKSRPFAALALGILSRPAALRGEEAEERAARASLLRPAFAARDGDERDLGATALALGMIRDDPAGTRRRLEGLLADDGLDVKLRGGAALGLGLLGEPGSIAAVRAAFEEDRDRDLRVEVSIAATLLGDPSAVHRLVAALDSPESSQFVIGSAALALGRIGDARAVGSLLRILESERVNGKYPDLTRALAAVALGQIADRRALQVLYRSSRDVNWHASVPAIEELLTIL